MNDSRRGIHDVSDLALRCDIDEGKIPCWIWTKSVVRNRPTAHIRGEIVHGARIAAIACGRDAERSDRQRWTMRCGEAMCLNPAHLVLAKTQGAALRLASKNGRMVRDMATLARLSVSRKRCGTQHPDWMVRWAIESGQSHRDVAHGLGVNPQTVSGWRRGANVAATARNPFSQLLRLAA